MAPLAVQKFAEEVSEQQDVRGENTAAVRASVTFFMSMTGGFAAQTVLLNKLPRQLKGTTVPFAFAVAMACSAYKQFSPRTPPTVRKMAE